MIADTVLLPGDPLRARHIASEFLVDACEVNTRRNMLGYTGHYRGMRVSVLGSGMGIPSCAIYATEL
ncbi:MAG: purine-nucleoside phosphorylase, partial [Rhodanobacter sp.]